MASITAGGVIAYRVTDLLHLWEMERERCQIEMEYESDDEIMRVRM